jgi:hypothetical protein
MNNLQYSKDLRRLMRQQRRQRWAYRPHRLIIAVEMVALVAILVVWMTLP